MIRAIGFGIVGVGYLAGAALASVPLTAPYGTWASPIAAEELAISGERYSETTVDQGALYWVESSPTDGRGIVMRRGTDGVTKAITPTGFSAMTRVHEYGGGALTVADGVVYFTNASDQQLYRQSRNAAPEALTHETNTRYANCAMDRRRDRLICVREDHRGPAEARNTLVAVPLRAGADVQVLFDRSDFVSDPAISPDGKRLAFLAWMHPNMPWDRVTLWVADLQDDGRLGDPLAVNAEVDEAARSPQWAPDGTLYFIGDRDGWWNLQRWDGKRVQAVTHEKMDLSFPAWQIGERTYGFLSDGRVVALFNDRGTEGVGIIELPTGLLRRLAGEVVQARALAVTANAAYFEAGFRDRAQALVKLDISSRTLARIREPKNATVANDSVSVAKLLEFPTSGGERAFGFYYAPTNARYRAVSGERPPLIVVAHGGPTLNTTPAYNVSLQYWTSRGFAVLDLNYRGSTGFGRAYRRALYGRMGVADVEDAVYGANATVAKGMADPKRLLIRGGSAGGFIVLAALTFHDTFAAGADYYGISDLAALRGETHKFESRYIDTLVGSFETSPERYRDRSPLQHLERFRRPVIVFQGLKDPIVPPDQSERIVDALRSKHVPVAYLTFPEESHGFRTLGANIIAREAELCFYGKVLGFQPAGEIADVKVENLPGSPHRTCRINSQ